MNTRTATAVVNAPRDQVFDYLSRVENLPDWASEFARELRVVEGKTKVVNGLGEFFVRFQADAASGVIDMFAGPDEEQLAVFPTRVVGLADGRTLYVFTMLQAPDMPDELFDGQYRSLLREFANIAARFG
jgi:hypothetical protein